MVTSADGVRSLSSLPHRAFRLRFSTPWQWVGDGTHAGPAFSDFLADAVPAATGRKMHFTGVTVLKLLDGKIVEEIGLDDGVTALTQLGLIRAA